MVKTDIFPALVTKFHDLFAIPLTNIYNAITATGRWPISWKHEFVTPIPKKSVPESMEDLRNISCTALISKIYESYVLEWLELEVSLKPPNQFGGLKTALSATYWWPPGMKSVRILKTVELPLC